MLSSQWHKISVILLGLIPDDFTHLLIKGKAPTVKK